MTSWPLDYIENIISGSGQCSECALVDCSRWKVKVKTADTHLCVDRDAHYATVNGVPVVLPIGTELWVNSASAPWFTVESVAQNADGSPAFTGLVKAERTDYVSGTPTGDPYVMTDPADGRDGSPDSAVAYAETCLPGGSRFTEGSYRSYIGQGEGEDVSTGYSLRCLGFVSTCFGIPLVPLRCPEIVNPSNFLDASGNPYPGSAWGAFQALRDHGKIRYEATIPKGAILFWSANELNGWFGHVAIMADEAGNVISSGAPGRRRDAREGEDGANYQYHETGSHPSVFKDTLLVVSHWTDPATDNVCGWTTPEIAFAPGMWNGKACDPESA